MTQEEFDRIDKFVKRTANGLLIIAGSVLAVHVLINEFL